MMPQSTIFFLIKTDKSHEARINGSWGMTFINKIIPRFSLWTKHT